MEELDVEAVGVEARQARDAVPLFEAQHGLLAGVVGRVEPVEPEDERGRLLAGGGEKT